MFKRIDHVEIVTEDLERAERFYTDVLGFKVRARDHIDRSTLGVTLDLVYLDLGGTGIELIKYGGPGAPAPPPGDPRHRMMALGVAGQQRTLPYLQTKRVAMTLGPPGGRGQ